MQLPHAGGLALASQLYSPHLDLHQRLLILDCLGQAAGQLAHAPLGLDRCRPLVCICPGVQCTQPTSPPAQSSPAHTSASQPVVAGLQPSLCTGHKGWDAGLPFEPCSCTSLLPYWLYSQ